MIKNDTLTRLEARLEALESRLAYQDHWLDTLDQALAGQDRRIERLERGNEVMQQRLREQHQALEGLASPGGGDGDQRPPHY